jgi:hypothetical protein
MLPPVNADPPGDPGRAGPSYGSVPEAVWNSRTQWGAILAGVFAGFAVVILMGTLGAAVGVTAGAVGVAATDTVNETTAEKAAGTFTIGATIWILLTALATGLVGGWVLNSTARRDRPYSSFIFGGVTWAAGVCLMLAVAAPGVGGLIPGAGGAAVAASTRPEILPRMTPKTTARAEDSKTARTMTDEEKAAALDAAEKAAAAAAGVAWIALGAQLISIAATMFAAGWRRHAGARVVTEIRPRPIPTA